MNQNKRPHSRKRTYGSGSAGVHKGDRVNTGFGPFGFGGRGGNNNGGNNNGGNHSSSPFGQMPLPKMNLKTILIIIVAVVVLFFVLKSCGGSLFSIIGDNNGNNTSYYEGDASTSDVKPDLSVSNLARAKRVTPLGDGQDVVTIMVYMCGTDLESKYGMATKDLQEMLNATVSDKVNIIVETGGCKQWKNDKISSSKNQIYKVEDDGLRPLEDNFGTLSMTNPKNLTNFINYCTINYPADRNMLIFWDHGGGSISGFGYDEKDPVPSSMTLGKINSALKEANTTFDFIGFDACLMATLENALVCNEYADYLIASEETEPGTGWYYSNWLTKLSENTSMPTVNIGQIIVDDFISSCRKGSPNSTVTLSVVDLAELDGTVPNAFRNFASSTNELLQSDGYKQVSDARAGVRQFAQSSKINQVDLVDLAERIGTNESRAFAEALKGCVKYNRSSISRCNGISIYFPYESTKSVKSAVNSYKELGLDGEYTKCIQSFASLEYGGQIAGSASQIPFSSGSSGDLLGSLLSSFAGSGSSTSPVDTLLGSFTGGGSSSAGFSIDPSTVMSLLEGFSGRSMPADYDWVDTQLIANQAQNISKNYLDPSRITVTDKDGKKVLKLTEEEWSLIQTVELNVYVKDGNGFIDLGLDNTFDFDDDDDMLLEHDGTWLTLNGNVCAYYLVSDNELADGSWKTIGRIPARLNGQLVNLQVIFDKKHPEGMVTGAYPMYEENTVYVQAKGDIAVKSGDKIELLCDYYNPDGSYSASYVLGSAITVPDSGLVLRNLSLDTAPENLNATYRITDIYGNHYWTPVINK